MPPKTNVMIDRNHPAVQPLSSKLENSANRPDIDRAVVLIVIVWSIALLPIFSILAPPPNVLTQRVATTINPNNAPWWELTALPRIGESLARKLTDFRQMTKRLDASQSAFNSPADLQRVQGIGPKTVRRIAPFLHYQPYLINESDLASQR